MNANDIYKMPVKKTVTNLWQVENIMSDVVPFGHWLSIPEDSPVEIKIHKNPYIDGTRSWLLVSLWWEGNPVAVGQEAGRAGRDFRKLFVTNRDGFAKLAGHLNALRVMSDGEFEEIDPDADHEGLTNFHGDRLEYFNEGCNNG